MGLTVVLTMAMVVFDGDADGDGATVLCFDGLGIGETGCVK
ncbi:uncharacterized protein G2W53_033754 [Senna tora]|uniref:Uncharacterized protein n=1 Tax=Senna tora TaxID=362788 RepID=A0A834W8P6_9FABA|nr:uncharacterized protein G2W53_033754 [Senna tora]